VANHEAVCGAELAIPKLVSASFSTLISPLLYFGARKLRKELKAGS
jgi:hypothetical protein